jgi:hypothetical protein
MGKTDGRKPRGRRGGGGGNWPERGRVGWDGGVVRLVFNAAGGAADGWVAGAWEVRFQFSIPRIVHFLMQSR